MKATIKTSILIKATPSKIWAILTDFENYPNWNPFIKSIQGKAEIGHQITARIEPPEANGMTFKPTILVVEKNKKLTWLGKLLFKGLFDGEHQFELENHHNGTTTFHHSEKFNGILVPLFKKQLNNNTRRGFELMNEKLKKLAEQ